MLTDLPPYLPLPPGRPETEPPPSPPNMGHEYGGLDRGIQWTVSLLRSHGIDTCQSCEGGPGHSYPEPTIDFTGGPGAGYRALGICIDHGLPVLDMGKRWGVVDSNQLDRPVWYLTFRRRPG